MSSTKSSEIKPVTVHIMGNEYHVSSPEDQIEKLEKAAKELDRRMREVKSTGNIVGIERIAVMVALNLSYEVLENQSTEKKSSVEVEQKIKQLQQKIDSALVSSVQMELT
jgi:cell division protein ZapA